MLPPPFPWFAFWVSFLVTLARSQSPVQTFFPGSIPLANRSPYLSAWHPSKNGSGEVSSSWPTFWDQKNILGWSGKIRVDGSTYNWMGGDVGPPNSGNVTNVQITPTRSIFTMQAGPMNVTVTYLSPIEPSDLVLQSLPFSYVSVEATSLDGQSHDVQIYSDISAEWLSGNRAGSTVTWSQNTASGGSIFLEVQLQSPQSFNEVGDQQAQDGTAYYAMANRQGLTWQIDKDTVVRGQFGTQGSLANTVSTAFATISPVFTVYGISVDLGQIQTTSEPVTWAVGYVRNPSIAYTKPDSTVEQLMPYFTTKYGSNIPAAIDDFTAGYADALARATAFDAAVIANASAVSSEYVDLVSLAARQSLSTLDITVSKDSNGNPNASDVRIFMKDIGSSVTTARINPVERIFAALPTLLYVNASWVGPLLAPILDAQDAITSAMQYAAQDIGTAYPNATGTHGLHNQGIEQTGNMLIMLYAHARFSGDGSLLQKHYNLTKIWADYLVGTTLTPSSQSDADGEASANMTNLAIKGIIGVKAMAQISHAVGNDADGQQYDSHAAALVGQWQSLALSSDQKHLLRVYNDQTSWALMYNLYADRLLGTNLVSDTILQGQTAYYETQLSSVPAFGLALDNSALGTSAAWLLFTAGTVTDNSVRNSLVQNAWIRASSNITANAFADQYNVQTGAVTEGAAGPAVGGAFSLLALNLTPQNISISGSSSSANSSPSASDAGHSSTPVGAIAGGVVGGIALIGLIAVGLFFCLRRRRRDQASASEKIDIANEPHRPALSPYTYSTEDARAASYNTSRLESGMLGPANASGPLELIGSNTSLVPPTTPDSGPYSSQSSKMRELSLNARLAYAQSESGSSNVGSQAGSQAGSASSREPLSPGGTRSTHSASRSGGGSSLSPTDVLGLRAEVENLRRVMQEIREERLAPPPEYTG
ncbi:DUF1793-domain-containing protein [Trametes versicolor FP-101664 SS1]|uniref:DUF1793-domain-containing protein n=1 Tax=Trametes versicolor (strain FP-101664) TaxID=717944 RepID=UPI000462344E|nr:DUF1793-domain-containing protein [Trametes versicolor FP-101664 SS1]EIW62884.1 DUF1793-domain-containing protein [Trametes versicolor FP-101664 SS1]